MAAPLIRVKTKDLVAAGVERVPKVVGVRDGLPVLEDDRALEVANVIWCTGYRQDYSWIDLPIFGEDGGPVHERGVVVAEPGMYFMGLIFQFALASDVLPGVGRDAKYIARHIASREAKRRASMREPAEVTTG
jgi:putative flavoprotein involved in K+ transport